MINRIVFFLYYSLFRLLARLCPSRPTDLKGRAFQNILIFSAAGIGDTLTDSVAIRALKETFPNARLTVVTHRRRSTIVQHNPYVDEVILYYKSIFRFISLTRELRARRFEAVVMLRGNDPDLWPLGWLTNRHAIVSCPIMTRFKFLISHPVRVPAWDQTHGVEQTLEIVRSLGADTADRRLVYRVRADEQSALREKLHDHLPPPLQIQGKIPLGMEENKIGGKIQRGSGDPWVVFQVGGGRRSAWRDWPVEHYAKLGRRLLEEHDVQLFLLGGCDLQGKAAEIEAAIARPGVVNLAGKLSLAKSAALLSLAKILVSTDTGIMHLGFAVGVDTLALIHCNNPASRVGPHGYGDKHPVVQLEPLPRVAISREVDMALVTPEAVWIRLEQLCQRNQISKKS